MTISIIKNNTQKYNNAVKKNTPLFVKFYSKSCEKIQKKENVFFFQNKKVEFCLYMFIK